MFIYENQNFQDYIFNRNLSVEILMLLFTYQKDDEKKVYYFPTKIYLKNINEETPDMLIRNSIKFYLIKRDIIFKTFFFHMFIVFFWKIIEFCFVYK